MATAGGLPSESRQETARGNHRLRTVPLSFSSEAIFCDRMSSCSRAVISSTSRSRAFLNRGCIGSEAGARRPWRGGMYRTRVVGAPEWECALVVALRWWRCARATRRLHRVAERCRTLLCRHNLNTQRRLARFGRFLGRLSLLVMRRDLCGAPLPLRLQRRGDRLLNRARLAPATKVGFAREERQPTTGDPSRLLLGVLLLVELEID